MTTLYDLTRAVAARTGQLNEGSSYACEATTSKTAIKCAAMLTEANDVWNRGTIWMTAAEEAREITDFASGVATISPALTATPAVGALFAIAGKTYPLADIVRAINTALRWYGQIPGYDESLTTIASTYEYSIPSGVTDIRQVHVATSKTSPYGYIEAHDWHADLALGKIIFDEARAAGYKIRVLHLAWHDDLADDEDVLSTLMSMQAVVEFAYAELLHSSLQFPGDDDTFRQLMNRAYEMAEYYRKQRPLPKLPHSIRFSDYGRPTVSTARSRVEDPW